jgi:hypothetical protein
MAEHEKNKIGLQKQVSSVFKGVPLPQNNGSRQPSGEPVPGQTPGVPAKPASAEIQIPKSSLISKLSQSEDTPDRAGQNKSTNVFPKTTSAKQTSHSSLINKLPQPKESLKRPESAVLHEEGVSLESAGTGLLQRIKNKIFKPKPGVNPARQKAMVIMVPILALVMIFAFRQVLSKAPRQTKGAGTGDVPIVTKADNSNQIDWKIPEPIKIVTKDPTELPDESKSNNQNQEQSKTTGEVKTATGTIIIRDIIYSDDKPSALVGSKIVYVGDVIDGITISKIDRDSVEFEKGGYRWEQKVRDAEKIPLSKAADESEGQSKSVQ